MSSNLLRPFWDRQWLKIHLVPHLVGGAVIVVFLRLPIFNPVPWFWTLAAVAFIQSFWEDLQREFTPPYPWWSAFWDVLFSVVGGAVTLACANIAQALIT